MGVVSVLAASIVPYRTGALRFLEAQLRSSNYANLNMCLCVVLFMPALPLYADFCSRMVHFQCSRNSCKRFYFHVQVHTEPLALVLLARSLSLSLCSAIVSGPLQTPPQFIHHQSQLLLSKHELLRALTRHQQHSTVGWESVCAV